MKNNDNGGMLVGLGVGAVVLLLASIAKPAETVALNPVADSENPDKSMGAMPLQGGYASADRWYELSSSVRIYIPFQTRSVLVSSYGNARVYQMQFLYNGRWYDPQNLLRVWNPIRALPIWVR